MISLFATFRQPYVKSCLIKSGTINYQKADFCVKHSSELLSEGKTSDLIYQTLLVFCEEKGKKYFKFTYRNSLLVKWIVLFLYSLSLSVNSEK